MTVTGRLRVNVGWRAVIVGERERETQKESDHQFEPKILFNGKKKCFK